MTRSQILAATKAFVNYDKADYWNTLTPRVRIQAGARMRKALRVYEKEKKNAR